MKELVPFLRQLDETMSKSFQAQLQGMATIKLGYNCNQPVRNLQGGKPV